VKHTIDFIDVMGIDTCHLGGFSRGAGLATCVAVASPASFETLIVSNSNTIGPPKGSFKHRQRRIWDGLESRDPTDPEYLRYNLWVQSYMTDYITEERCKAGAYMNSQPKRVETSEALEEAEGFDLPSGKPIREHIEDAQQEIKNGILDMPVMYMFGRNGINDPIDMAITAYDIFAEENPDARFKIINHCGHMVMLERPEEYSQTIIDFVDFHCN
jgi:pimeloyl-ACP methyl ester carboxylesterase